MTAVPAGFESSRAAYLTGAKAVGPFLFGTVPFGLVTGIATKAAGLGYWEAVAMTIVVFAGTAQLAALPLLVAGAPALMVILTAFIINLRFVIYSASVAPYFRHLPFRWRLLLGYFLSDTGFALFMRIVSDRPDLPWRHWYFLGGGTMVATVWCVSAVAGVLAGAQVPAAWQLEFAATLGIVALMAPFMRGKPQFAAAAAAGAVALLTAALPLKLGLLCGVVAGIVTGVLAERVMGTSAA